MGRKNQRFGRVGTGRVGTGWTAALAVCGVLAFAGAAHAEMLVIITPNGNDVVASFAGSINTTDLTAVGAANPGARIHSGFNLGSYVGMGVHNPALLNFHPGISGPMFFGDGASVPEFDVMGDPFGLIAGNGVYLAQGYVSETIISGSSTYDNQSIQSLGLFPGTYVYTWGSGEAADSMEVRVLPEPTAAILLGLGGLAIARRRRG